MSNKRIYVGNLPFKISDQDLRELFEPFGTVHNVAIISDRDTGRPRGFAFVEMDDGGAAAAIQGLDGSQYGGRSLRVNEAKDRPEKSDRPSRGGGGGGGGGRSRDY